MKNLKNKIKQIKLKRYKLLFYDNKYIHYMDKDGFKFRRSIASNAEIRNTLKYDINNPYCCYNIDLMLSKSKSNTRLVKSTYKGSKKSATFICGNCGSKFQTNIGNVEKSTYKYCINCVKNIQYRNNLKYEAVKEEVKSYGYELLGKYSSMNNRISVMDSEGYKGKVKLDTLRHNGGISKFAVYNPYALDNLKLFCKLNGFKCKVINQKYYGWEKPLKLKCSCGKIYQLQTKNLIHGFQSRCPECSRRKSQLEIDVKDWLIDNNVEFKEEFVFKDCKYKNTLPFDFYLPDYNICIEVQGEQHYHPVSIYGGEKEFEKQIKRDKIKQQYCDYNNIKLIVLPYNDVRNNKFKDILSFHIMNK